MSEHEPPTSTNPSEIEALISRLKRSNLSETDSQLFPTCYGTQTARLTSDLARVADDRPRPPTLSEDHWPFLPKEIFAVAGAEESPLSYKGEHIIHFGMCVKEADGEWDEWLSKFERLFKAMDAEEAFVMLRHPAWDSGEFGGWFYYRWRSRWPDEVPVSERPSGDRGWVFEGGPRRFYGENG